jgi:N-acetylneuraminic acid mutarotase
MSFFFHKDPYWRNYPLLGKNSGVPLNTRTTKACYSFMRTTVCSFLLLFISVGASAQSSLNVNTPWIFLKGDSVAPNPDPIYGTLGQVAEGNKPGARHFATTWRDASGNLYLFGGGGSSSVDEGYLNDLWKYDVSTKQWIFLKGNNIANARGIYGVKGVATPENQPGARERAAGWVDASGNLWLFGGLGYYTGGLGYLNDLWKYEPATNQWTWVNGDNGKDVPRVNGTPGVASPTNSPGSRAGATTWKDAAGKFWLFGGGIGTPMLNDMWKYDPVTNEWTCMRISGGYCVPWGRYGTRGVEHPLNTPSCRSWSSGWSDNSGNLWLFGGGGPGGNFNDLWRYSTTTNNWTWVHGDTTEEKLGVYGTKGVFNSSNKPGSRYGSGAWVDNAGKFYLFGGSVSTGNHVYDYFNDMWKYDPALNQWAWISGDKTPVHYGVYGSREVPAAANKPGGRRTVLYWQGETNKFWMMGGYSAHPNRDSTTYVTGYYNDLWQYDHTTNFWAWMKGDSTVRNIKGAYGESGQVAVGNKPGARASSSSWRDSQGNLYLFGGQLYRGDRLNDLWKYNTATNQWVWIKGSNTSSAPAVYGVRNTFHQNNTPSGRFGGVTWNDGTYFWLFGGTPPDYFGQNFNAINDLWKYDFTTNSWAWVNGDTVENTYGVYGIKGVASATSRPGARRDAVSWRDTSGNFWLFGGRGFAETGSEGWLNDLWRYNITTDQWVWISGDKVVGKQPVYGTRGVPSPLTKPGGLYDAVSWIDQQNNLWLFGGFGESAVNFGALNDLWKFDVVTREWTWMHGSGLSNRQGNYGAIDVPSSNNMPGCRTAAFAWSDQNNNFWLFGGSGYARGSTVGFLNDTWKYNLTTKQWTWVKGDSVINSIGSPGVKGVAAATNQPLAKSRGATWTDAANATLWMYSGVNNNGFVEDLWRFNAASKQWTWVKGQLGYSARGSYGVLGEASLTNVPGARAEAATWTDTSGNHWLFGGVVENQNNDLWKYNTTLNRWAWMKGDTIPATLGIYGSKGVTAATNKPGARKGSASWVDNSGKLWLFGGLFVESFFNGKICGFNDLWKFDLVTNNWTWVKGDSASPVPQFPSNLQTTGAGHYGTQGIAADANTPPERYNAQTWKDKTGNLWLYGGRRYRTSNGGFSDLWKYNVTTNQWTWVKGATTFNVGPSYGSIGVPSLTNTPGYRYHATAWTDTLGNFWLFGGFGANEKLYSDLWKYDPATNMWTWMKGSQTPSATNVLLDPPGTSSAYNLPAARWMSQGWVDVFGKLWMFGGSKGVFGTESFLSDFWKYDPSNNQWTYYNGNLEQYGKANRPGSRYTGMTWADKSGHLFLFGGKSYGTSGIGMLNDMWKIFTGTKYVFIGNGNWSTASNWQNQLVAPTTITPGMDVTIDHEVNGTCTNNGPITLLANGLLRVESGKKLTINQGDLLSSGDVVGPGNRPGQVNFTGAAPNALRSTGSMSTPIVLENNKRLTLTANSVTSRVILTGGSKLTLDKFHLSMDTASLIADASSFIITNDTGRLIRNVGTTPVVFHIGADSLSYTPITVTNTGTEGHMRVNVSKGVPPNVSPSTTDNVNRTWKVNSLKAGANASITIQWNASDEQPGFARTNAYIAQSHSCPLPPNCVDSYFDVAARTAASGTGPFTLTRDNVTNPSDFVVRSGNDVSRFTGNGTWDNEMNWTIGVTPSKIIPNGKEIIIDHPVGGSCNVTGDITIQRGGKLTVMPGKVLNVTGKIIVEN